MKNIINIILFFTLVSCGVYNRSQDIRTYVVNNRNEKESVLLMEHPELTEALREGYITGIWVVKHVYSSGDIRYSVNYKSVRKAIKDYCEKMSLLQECFPELYKMYCNGIIIISDMYNYVDSDGVIQTHITYYYR